MPVASFSLIALCVFALLPISARGEEPATAPASKPDAPKLELAKQPAAYPDAEAAKHVGEEARITGKVVAVGTSRQGNTYLNFGAAFPRQLFSGLIRAKDAKKVGDAKKFEGKTVAVTGKIESYNDKPQILITSPDQIKIVEEQPSAATEKP